MGRDCGGSRNVKPINILRMKRMDAQIAIIYSSGWNPLDKSPTAGSTFTLSNNNRTLSMTSGSVGIRAVAGNTAGSHYFELKVDAVGPSPTGYMLAANWGTLPDIWSSATLYGMYRANGQVFYTGSTYVGAFGSWATGDVIGVVVTHGTSIKFYRNNALVTTITASVPPIGTVVKPTFWTEANPAAQATLRTRPSEFTYAIPAGAAAWEPDATIAPAIMATTPVTTAVGVTTLSVPIPGNTQVGDLLLTHLTVRTASWTAPAGWTIVDGTGLDFDASGTTTWYMVYKKTATLADISGSVAVTVPSSATITLHVQVVRGSTGTPVVLSAAKSYTAAGATNAHPAAVATGTAANQLGIATLTAATPPTTITVPAGFVPVTVQTTATSSNRLASMYKPLGVGTTTAGSWTSDNPTRCLFMTLLIGPA